MKKKWKIWTGAGIVCVLVLLAAVWYSVQYNDSRLVEPMDFGSYVFRAQDFPMIFALMLIWGYAAALVATLILASLRSQDKKGAGKTTRQLNPKLSLLGMLGFLGFGGFWTYHIDGSVFPFAFFLFFGFFGFYYEGKMSGTFMDERFPAECGQSQAQSRKHCIYDPDGLAGHSLSRALVWQFGISADCVHYHPFSDFGAVDVFDGISAVPLRS